MYTLKAVKNKKRLKTYDEKKKKKKINEVKLQTLFHPSDRYIK